MSKTNLDNNNNNNNVPFNPEVNETIRKIKSQNQNRNAFLVGGGIASMASAAYLIKEGHFKPENITIFETLSINGGSLDGQKIQSTQNQPNYLIRGGRMMNTPAYTCTYDLFSFIPSLDQTDKTVLDEIKEFNTAHPTHSNCRLVENGKKINFEDLGFSTIDRLQIVELMALPEDLIKNKSIESFFSKHFFETNFWYMWCTMFAFQPWHSLIEFKRYIHRFIHEFPKIHTLAGVDRSPYNQYDSLALPLESWLKKQGVQFENQMSVTDIHGHFSDSEKIISQLLVKDYKNKKEFTIEILEKDLVFLTIGSMTAASDIGDHKRPAKLNNFPTSDWTLWENLAKWHPDFGQPDVFSKHIDQSKWLSFTLNFKGDDFFKAMEKFTGNVAGSGGLVTFKDSNWLMSVVLAHQPHFRNQPADVTVAWGYGLFPDKVGNFINKKMSDCTGEEILLELLYHLKFETDKNKILESANIIPCMMPYITSQFLVRDPKDRPKVIPKGSKNLALLGQFVEIPDDVVFTVEYSVRAAQIAVFGLLNLNKKVSALYKGQFDPKVLVQATKTLFG